MIFAVLAALPALLAQPALSDESMSLGLQVEVNYLEEMHRRGDMSPSQRTRLAEIYFLTSRCDDVKKLKPEPGTKVLCACGGRCDKNSEVAKIERFRQLLEKKNANWRDQKLQLAWHSVQNTPEGRYWALKAMRGNLKWFLDPKLRTTRLDLEKSLESLEVTPEAPK